MPDVNVNVAANISKAKKDLLGLEKDIKRMQTTASKGININGKGNGRASSSISGGKFGVNSADLRGLTSKLAPELSDLSKTITSQFGKLTGVLGGIGRFAANPYATAAAGAVTVLKMGYDHFKQKATEQAAITKQDREYGRVFSSIRGETVGAGEASGTAVDKLIKNLRLLSGLSGKPFEQIAQSAGRLMVAFNGSTSETLKFTKAITAWSMATGRSTDEFADLIVKIKSMDRVEAGVIKQMSEMGIPVYQELANLLGVSVDKAKELANNGAIYSSEMIKAFEATAKSKEHLIDLNKALKEDIDTLKGSDLDARIAYLERIIYGRSGNEALAREDEIKRDKARDLQDILDSPSARMLADAGGGYDLVDNAIYDVKRAGYKLVEGLFKAGAWSGYHLRAFTSSRGGLTDTDYEKYAKDVLRIVRSENDKYRSHMPQWERRGLKPEEGIAREGAWQDRKTGEIKGAVTAEEAAKSIIDGGSDDKVKAIEDAVGEYEDILFTIEKALQHNYLNDSTRAALEEEYKYTKEIIGYLQKALEIRKEEVDIEVAKLKKQKTANKLQEEQWKKDGEMLKLWNKSHSKDDNKFLSNINSNEDALKLYEEALTEIREGRGDEVIKAYVDFWGEFWKKAQEDKKKAEEEAAKKAKEEAEKAEKEKKKAKEREKFFLQHRGEKDAGAKFKKELIEAQDRMRELDITEPTIKRIGDEMKHNAGEEYRKKIQDINKDINATGDKLRKVGVRPTSGNYQSLQQWKWDEMESRPQNVMKTSYERGAWGQALKLQEYDETALQIQEQRKDLLEQLKVMQEQKAIAEKQLAAIERINTTPKAQ